MYICACAIFFPHPLLILGIHCGYGVTTGRCLKSYVHNVLMLIVAVLARILLNYERQK